MFGKLIKEYRTALKLSQEDIAFSLGISTNHLSRIELGKINPSGNLIKRIINLVAENSNTITMQLENTDLYGIILMLELEKLNPKNKGLVFNECIHLIQLVKSVSREDNC